MNELILWATIIRNYPDLEYKKYFARCEANQFKYVTNHKLKKYAIQIPDLMYSASNKGLVEEFVERKENIIDELVKFYSFLADVRDENFRVNINRPAVEEKLREIINGLHLRIKSSKAEFVKLDEIGPITQQDIGGPYYFDLFKQIEGFAMRATKYPPTKKETIEFYKKMETYIEKIGKANKKKQMVGRRALKRLKVLISPNHSLAKRHFHKYRRTIMKINHLFED